MAITRVRLADHSGWETGGAVPHALVNGPIRGYGIFIENMMEVAGKSFDRRSDVTTVFSVIRSVIQTSIWRDLL